MERSARTRALVTALLFVGVVQLPVPALAHGGGLTITIGRENVDPKLRAFTLVTSTYEVAGMSGVIGVMGPTRMPYKKVIALVEHTSRLMGDLL